MSQVMHRSFRYTFWAQIPWAEGCEVCDHLKTLNSEAIGQVTNHWHKMATAGLMLDPEGVHHEIGAWCTKDDCTEPHRPLDPDKDDYDLLINQQNGDLIEVQPPTKQRPGDQVLPSGDLSISDDQQYLIDRITERREVGIERYGQGHRPFNGRHTFLDLFEEQLDFLVYLTSILRATEADRETLIRAIEQGFVDKGIIPEDLSYREIAEFAVARIYGWLAGQEMARE